MLYVGMDCSIKDVAFAVSSKNVSVHYSTGLSLESDIAEYMRKANDVSYWLTSLDEDYTLLIDFTMFAMKARQSQMRLNSLFIGCIIGIVGTDNIKLIEPLNVRKALGLKGNCEKELVYEKFNTLYPQYNIYTYTINHIQDAIVLSVLGEKGKL